MNVHEGQIFNYFMALSLLIKAQEAIKNNDEEMLRKISQYGIIYSFLCITYNPNYNGHY